MPQDDTQIEARLEEQDSFSPPEEFVEQANVSEAEIYEEFEENWPGCWEQAADLLDWYEEYDEVLDDSDAPFYEWFVDGKLNVSLQLPRPTPRRPRRRDGDRMGRRT